MIKSTQKYFNNIRLQKEKSEIENSLENDFKSHRNANSIPVPKTAFSATTGIMGLCRKGSITIEAHQQEYCIIEGELMVILPKQVVLVKEQSEDFEMDYFILSQAIIDDILSGISRLSPLFFIQMRKKITFRLAKDEVYRYSQYYNLVNNRLTTSDCKFQREYAVSIMRLFYLDLYNSFKDNILSINSTPYSRKEKLAYNFFLLILKHYKESREMNFYADQLSITPKYLSKVIKDVSGRSAKDWIVEYTLLEIKSLLDNTALNVQEITLDTNFSNQASLGRFFKQHTGVSPLQYRLRNKY